MRKGTAHTLASTPGSPSSHDGAVPEQRVARARHLQLAAHRAVQLHKGALHTLRVSPPLHSTEGHAQLCGQLEALILCDHRGRGACLALLVLLFVTAAGREAH